MTFRAIQGKFYPIVIGLAIFVFTASLDRLHFAQLDDFLQRIAFISYDTKLNISLKNKPVPKTVSLPVTIASIDEKSLQTEGRWPWSRSKIADLVTQLFEQGATVVGFDVLFSEPQRNIIDQVITGMPNYMATETFVDQISQLSAQFDADARLSQAISEMDVVMAMVFHDNVEDGTVGQLPQPLSYELNLPENTPLSIQSHLYSLATTPKIMQQHPYGGFINASRDEDGVVRRTPLVMMNQGNLYPSLGYAAARLFLLSEDINLIGARLGNHWSLDAVVDGNRIIPTDQTGKVLVPYIGSAYSYPYVSATDILNGTAPAEYIENKIILVGPTAAGLHDLQSTPVGSNYPGVEVHANVINGLLNNTFLHQPEWAQGVAILILYAFGILLFVYPFFGPISMITTSVALMAAILTLDYYLFTAYGFVVDLVRPILFLFTITLINFAYGFLFESLKKQQVKAMFGQYVPSAHVEEMLKDPDNYSFEGESKELTVLFADIRSFTTISESLSANQLKSMLNEFFTPMTEIIFESRGTIDKYVGDMIMAFWGAPLPDKNHADHAINAAMTMLTALDVLRPQFVKKGYPQIHIGIGINTGPMNVGDMGSTFRRAYTVLGDAVNLGSRLEGLTKYYGVSLLIGEETFNRQSRFICRRLDKVKVKGKDQPIQVYEPICQIDDISIDQQEELDKHHQALDFYLDQKWDQSFEIFSELLTSHPQTAIYRIYMDRIKTLSRQKLEPYWDGVFTRTEK